MTGIEPQTSGIGSNRSANLATTTAHFKSHLTVKLRSPYVSVTFLVYSTNPRYVISNSQHRSSENNPRLTYFA